MEETVDKLYLEMAVVGVAFLAAVVTLASAILDFRSKRQKVNKEVERGMKESDGSVTAPKP